MFQYTHPGPPCQTSASRNQNEPTTIMPLLFRSLNRGAAAFGFFNIDTDLLLLEHYFFFADEFCASIVQLAERKDEISFEMSWDVHDIPRQKDIGDLMGAIHGLYYSGSIGEVYKRFPFLRREEDFKQKPEGFQNRSILKRSSPNRVGTFWDL
jgi:hypothetical protein